MIYEKALTVLACWSASVCK